MQPLLWPLKVATRKSFSLWLWASFGNDALYELFLGVFLGVTLPLSRFAQAWLWKSILPKQRTPVLVGLIVSPPLSFPFPRSECYFFGSAKNPVRFCTSAIQKIKHNTLCRFRFQFSSCQLSFFIFLDFFCSLFLFSFCLSDSVCLYWRCIFLHLISLSCILLIFWFTQQVWDSKDLQTASDLNKEGRKQKWWRQIWQMEETLVPGY